METRLQELIDHPTTGMHSRRQVHENEQSIPALQNFLVKQGWKSATKEWGGLFFIYAEISEISRRLDEFKDEFGNKNSFEELTDDQKSRLENLIEMVLGHLKRQQSAPDARGNSPVSKCFLDGNPENDVPNNKPFAGQCAEYERVNNALSLVGFYLRDIQTPDAIPPVRNLQEIFNNDFKANLDADLIADPQFKTLFEYVFPMSRLSTLVSLYCIEHVSGLPGRKEMFDRTKELIEELFYTVRYSGDDDWWRKKAVVPKGWWDEPLNLPPWLIIMMTPLKILQALFILVPPLQWLLDMLNWKPNIPPHRRDPKKNDDICRD